MRVDAVAGEAAADLVVDAAAGHRAQRLQRHPRLAAAEQELDHRGRRELRRAAPAAVHAVVAGRSAATAASSGAAVELGVGGRDPRPRQARRAASRSPCSRDLVAALGPGVRDGLDDLRPGGHAVARLRREVRAAVERHLLGREEHVQRPAALAGHRLHRLHVERVDVRALLAVDLHAHEALVHQRRGRRVLEGLALHDVAPVAAGVADRHEQRAVELARAGQRLVAPGQPVDRVVAVLEQVRGWSRGRGRWPCPRA